MSADLTETLAALRTATENGYGLSWKDVRKLVSAVENVLKICNTYPPDGHRYAPYPITKVRKALTDALGPEQR